ncbi:DUF268 domain-containing protein [Roseovarius sp. 10]|uniref:DUF268 domain-containing protein n=1 Tax=Roseovarius sp. 10 TaxID=3080563 RepID=UPI0029529FF1|nr:DUF268 domain-containing protein [Roseovarius sp. 10]MDV7199733.1 DUF268 domain-containing protein [Roseovarius sp. 10]
MTDFNSSAGVMKGHYFHQDLLVASLIFADNPTRHIDIGSRVDGFVAHVASFRPIEILDIRDLPSSVHENIIFTQADLTQNIDLGVVDSISCLHALEHFGLGRYGDMIDPEGHLKGLRNLVDALSPRGKLYVSFPISNSPRVEFNAHRVFTPDWILGRPEVTDNLDMVRFDFVDDKGDLHTNKKPCDAISSELKYGCGIYTFEKSKMFK